MIIFLLPQFDTFQHILQSSGIKSVTLLPFTRPTKKYTMKKSILYVATGLTLLLSQACKKSQVSTTETVQSETIEATINSNESYRYAMPVSENPESYNVVSSGSSGATIVIESNVNETTFVYTPASNFTGTESVVISNSEPVVESEHHSGGKHHGGKHHSGNQSKKHGGCHSGNGKAKHGITFNITVKSRAH